MPVAAKLSHLDAKGKARMVDVGAKPVTDREALAAGEITMSAAALRLIRRGEVAKGDPLQTARRLVHAGQIKKGDPLQAARLAGIMAAKKTSELIPLCHPLPLTRVAVEFVADDKVSAILIEVTAETQGQTGVEMEALTAAAVGLLTIYDMCKAADRAMQIECVRLLEKSGGKSGHFIAP